MSRKHGPFRRKIIGILRREKETFHPLSSLASRLITEISRTDRRSDGRRNENGFPWNSVKICGNSEMIAELSKKWVVSDRPSESMEDHTGEIRNRNHVRDCENQLL
jgi:hypothetical protein